MILRDFQINIAEKIEDILFKENKRFVGAKVPTGGGKSYLFMDLFIKVMNQFDLENQPSDDIISNVPIKYYTPTTGIVSQTRINIIKNIVMDKYIERYYNGDIHDSILKIGNRMIDSAFKNNKDIKVDMLSKLEELYTQSANSNENPETIIRRVFDEFLPLIESGSEQLLKKEFPKLELVCYKKIEDVNVDKIDKNTRLIVFDEAHRTGSKIWGSKAKEMLKKLDKTKFLSITATPERDIDGIDPMLLFAHASGDYSIKELRNKKYLASDMSLVEALEKGLLLKPNIVNFDCRLDKTEEYKKIKDIIIEYDKRDEKNSNSRNPATKSKTFKGLLTINQQNMPVDPYHSLLKDFLEINKITGKLDFLREELAKNGDKKILETLEIFLDDRVGELKDFNDKMSYYKNFEKIKDLIFEIDDPKTSLHEKYKGYRDKKISEIFESAYHKYPYLVKGKHICFAPSTSKKSDSKRRMYETKDKIVKYLKIPDENVLITHSNPDVISEKEDRQNLAKFMLSTKYLVMVAMNKFNEGMHVGGVIALEMFREISDESSKDDKIDPKILFTQMIGRCLHSISKRRKYQ